MNSEPQISRFDTGHASDDSAINFDNAGRLHLSGSTCDAYVARHHRRRVFVKRLKEEYRYDAVYRAALEKEFELGVELSHPGLPQYREIHGDYVVMDYVDGYTLAEILDSRSTESKGIGIARRWLESSDNLRKIVESLVEVVAYLHSHNIVHSDVKTDNIMITRDTYNVVLIDLDKAFTAWLDDTSGSRENYGVEEGAPVTDIDFHGIAIVLDKLKSAGYRFNGMERLEEKCLEPGVSADELIDVLKRRPSRPNHYMWGAIAGILMIIGLVAWLLLSGTKAVTEEVYVDSDTIALISPAENHEAPQTHEELPIPVAEVAAPTVKNEYTVIKKIDIDDLLHQHFDLMSRRLDDLDTYSRDGLLTTGELLDSITRFSKSESSLLSQACEIVMHGMKLEDNVEAMKAVWHTELYRRYSLRSDSVQKKIGAEIARKSLEDKVSR